MIATWGRGLAADHMDESILVDLAPLIERHPWWRARASLTLGLLRQLGVRPPARVLDAGCGWGVTLAALERSGYSASGLDVSRRALERLDRPGRALIEADLTAPMPEAEPFAAVLALDVIEHLDDDRSAVRNLARLVAPGGVLVVSVPAGPDLYGEFDAIQGHRRRYDPDTLRSAFSTSGLALERMTPWGQWLLAPLKRSRGRSRARPGDTPADTYRRYLALPPWPAPLALRALFAREQGRALAGRLQAGTSLFAVGRQPTEVSANPTKADGFPTKVSANQRPVSAF